MELAAKLSVKVNSRVHEPPGPKARGSPETSDETRVARTIPSPCFDFATRAGVSRLPTRAFLFLLVLVAGVSFLSPEAFAQNRNTWKSTFFIQHVIRGVTFPSAFRNTTGTESFRMTATQSLSWITYTVRVCAKTSTPTSTATSYVSSDCTIVPSPNTASISFNSTFSMTSAMVSNGGVVVVMTTSGGGVVFGQWVPTAAPAIVLSRSAALPVAEGSSATYTVKIRVRPTGSVKVRVASDNPEVKVKTGTGTAGSTLDLTFGPGNWNTAQTVTVSADSDDDSLPDTARLIHTTVNADTSAEYDGAATVDLTVNVADDDAAVLLSATSLTVTEASGSGRTATFTVKLATRPTADVVIGVSGDDATEGSVSPSQMTFTQSDWNQAQQVTVTAVDDDVVDGNVDWDVTLASPTSTDTDYSGLSSRTVDVSTTDDDLSILSVSGGGEVAEGDSGTTSRATFTVTLSSASRQAVSVSYATSDGTAEAGSDYESATGTVTFSPGETSKTVAVTINGDDEAEGNETFTLALTSTPNGQIDPQNSSAQAVIKNDDEKMVDAGMSGEFSVGETTVMVDSTLPEDTGLEVVLPSELESGGAAIEELTVTLGPTEREIDGDLFGYTGRRADHVLVDIDVSPVPDEAVRICLPVTENLRRAAGRQRLYLIRFSGGRWEELASETEGGMVCADVRGFGPFAVVFEIDYAKRRVGEVNRAILPELSRAMTASTLEAITSRIDDAMAGGGTTGAFGAPSLAEPDLGWAEPGLRLGEFEDGEELSLTDAVDGSYYSVSLAGGYDPLLEEEESEAEPAPASRSGGLGMWISGDYRNLSGKGGGLVDWDGRVISGHLGADYRFGRSFLAGVATSWSQGSFDYTGRGEGSARVSGDYGSRMNSFHPYLGLSLSRRLGLWAAGGWGFGEIRMDDGEITGRQRASTRLGTLATGADLLLLGGEASSLSLKGEAWISRVKVKGNGGRIEGLRVKTNRLRAALEGSHALSLGSGSSLVPSLEFAIRRDGGDGETGVGGELGGGISLVSSVGLTVEARGRGLLFHQGDAKEWGVGGSVRFDPGGDGRGLSMSVIPSWGNSASGVQSIWESEGAEVGSADTERSLSLETEVGYGFAALGDRGLLTPYGAFGRSGGDGRSYRAGSRLSMGGKFDVSLEGMRTETGAGDPEHGITLQGRLNW